MYSNEGAVDPTAVKMSQMVGVFLTGLGLAAVTMRPATVDASDLVAIRGDITSSIADLKGSITTVNASVTQTNSEVRTLASTLNGLDIKSIIDAVDAVVGASRGLEAGIQDIKSILDGLDLSVDLDLAPVLDQILSAHNVEMQRMLDILNRLNASEAAQADGWNGVRDELVAILDKNHGGLTSQVDNLIAKLESLEVEVDLTPLSEALVAIRATTTQHSQNFDEFVDGILGAN